MIRKHGLPLLCVAALFVALLPAAPAQAATAYIGRFWANCGVFSLDVAVSGTNNDLNNQDRFRYLITDGNNKKLYLEDSTRPIGTTLGSVVVNMSFDNDGADGAPGKNPIKLEVIDLDANGNQIATLQTATFDAGCLPASGTATFAADFRPPHFLKGTFVAATPIYQQPGAGQLGLSIAAGKEHFIIYRSLDGQWLQVDVGGNDMVWVPYSAVPVDLSKLNTPPNRIDLSDPARPSNTVIVPPPGSTPIVVPGGVASARVTSTLRFRAGPSTRALRLDTIPRDTVVAVLGRSSNSLWLKVVYNNLNGWVSTCCITLIDAKLRDLPVYLE